LNLLAQLAQLARSPRIGAAAILVSGRLRSAAILVALATAIATVNTLRVAADAPLAPILYGDRRSPAVTMLLDALGRDRTAVVLYLVERSWDAALTLTAVAPAFYWLLGSTAIHAAARLRGRRRPYRPMLVVLGYAVGLTALPAAAAALTLGSRPGPGLQIAELIGIASLIFLGVIAWRAIQAHYGLSRGPALAVLATAALLFYAVPLLVIVLVVIALVIAAVALGYIPAP
jgi:hypothetical protein